MFTVKSFAILAIAGTAIAAPQNWGGWAGKYFGHGDYQGDHDQGNVATQVDVVTAYTTVTAAGQWGGHWGGDQAAPTGAAPAAPAATGAPASSGSNDGTYMSVVSEWRSKMGLSALTQDSTLQANALKTVQDGNGQMVHELNPGSFAQVLAPGDASDFEKVFVGGWLCERSNLPGLDGICATMSQGWAYNGETGHADILVSSAYSKIGCALADGIWGCDLA